MHKRFFRGFTIVELLIVIAVIGILAAVTVVSYNGVKQRAYDSAVKNDLLKFADALNVYYADNGRYPIYSAELDTVKSFKASRGSYDTTKDALAYCTETDVGNAMKVMAWSKSGTIFYISDEGKPTKAKLNTYLGCDVLAIVDDPLSDPTSYYLHTVGSGWASNV